MNLEWYIYDAMSSNVRERKRKRKRESANKIAKEWLEWGRVMVFVLRMNVSEFRNVANRSNNRWPDRKIIEKYCREDNNLFWQVCFRHRCRCRHRYCCCSLLFVFRFRLWLCDDCDVLQTTTTKKDILIKYLWFTNCIAHRSSLYSQNHFHSPSCSCTILNKHTKNGLY